ncbi:MAG: hypothetical protein U9Q74_13685 [Gemmatimonadota bacterium]|nr:hypothetical protein [Gemmatimonadota bacterium]
MISETRERFIRSIAERLAPGRIVEAYFFPSIRQGQVETGVAVIAATPELPAPVPAAAEGEASGAEAQVPAAPEPDAAGAAEPVAEAEAPLRAEVFTATYRWTRKGPDRGKWAVDVVPEAHAPIPTVGAVVRGVQERAGEALDAHRMTGEEVRAVLPAVGTAAAADAAAGAAAATA